ncbi:hypothetical protein LEP1GSC005_4100 [Leptospira santarosai str. ST188]|nr:hypothetical protein LEP1GSC005_4100 [Leptospira santarosai str. ST188]
MGKIFLHSDRKIESALVESRMNVETILFPKWYFNILTLEQRKEAFKTDFASSAKVSKVHVVQEKNQHENRSASLS